MGDTIVNGVVMTSPTSTHFALRGKGRQYSSSGGVLTITEATRNPDARVLVLGNITAAEAAAFSTWLRRGDPITLESDGFGGIVYVIFDFFEAEIEASSGRGVGRLHYLVGDVVIQSPFTVTTLPNDFGITAAGEFLVGVPSWQEATFPGLMEVGRWQLIAAGDGVEAIVEIVRLSGADGSYNANTEVPDPAAAFTGEDFQYVQVTTLPNDFGITAADAPWLTGQSTVLYGPSGFVVSGTWLMTAAGDGTTATVTILRVSGADGPYIQEVA